VPEAEGETRRDMMREVGREEAGLSLLWVAVVVEGPKRTD
jgi:hypothetical protein